MTRFEQFCDKYGLDPESAEAEAQWIESRRQLQRLTEAAESGKTLQREQPPLGPEQGQKGRFS